VSAVPVAWLLLGALGCRPDVGVYDVEIAMHEEIGSLVEFSWTQEGQLTTWGEFRKPGGEWQPSPPELRDAGQHTLLLPGIKYGVDIEVRFMADTGDGGQSVAEASLATSAPPAGFPLPDVTVSDPDRYDDSSPYLLAALNGDTGGWTSGTYWLAIINRKGDVLWAVPTPDRHWTLQPRIAASGDAILWDEATFWSDWDMGVGSQIHRSTLDGAVVSTHQTIGLHHPFTELDDGTLVWGAVVMWTSEQLRSADGIIWDCAALHESRGTPATCQSNGLYWNPLEDTFLFSFYTTNTVVEIDHQTGETMRVWGDLAREWTFVPPESAFKWQHGINYTETGSLLLSTRHDPDDGDPETVAREYTVDADSKVLREIWSFGEGEGIHAETAGEAHRLPGGNTLHNYGSAGLIREVTPGGEIVWEVDWGSDRLLGQTVFIDDLHALVP